MFLSLALICLGGILIYCLFPKIKIPALIGYLLLGILLNYMGLMDNSLLALSSDIRKIALIIILLKAGLSLDFKVLKKVGRPAILMCFLPATLEIIAFAIFGPILLHLSLIESLLIGSVMGAVSPAVVVPRMTHFIDNHIGTNKGIPQMIIAGSSADDVYCIVLFTTFTQLLQSDTFNVVTLVKIPTSIILGIALGLVLGLLLAFLFKKIHLRDTLKIIILFGVAFITVFLENILDNTIINMSSYLAIMTLGMVIYKEKPTVAQRLTVRFNKIWIIDEVFLFVLVGASVQINQVANAGWIMIGMILIGLIFRVIGTYLCVLATPLNIKERIFVMIAELPKATVQAAIGGVLIGLTNINQDFALYCLTFSVVAICLCAPLGAFGIDLTYKKLLSVEN